MSTARPLDPAQRYLHYLSGPQLEETPRQRRRRKHKAGHLMALNRRGARAEVKAPCGGMRDGAECARYRYHKGTHRSRDGQWWPKPGEEVTA